MIVPQTRRRGRRLGLVTTLVDGSTIIGSSPIQHPIVGGPVPVRPPVVNKVNPIVYPTPSPIATPVGYPVSPWTTPGAPVPVVGPVWGSYSGNGSPSGWSGRGGYGGASSQYSQANNPTSENNLAQLTLQYQQNPSSLTAQQWQQLQEAGVIPGTSPYSNAAYTSTSGASGAIDPATGVPYATELAAAQAAETTTAAATASTGLTTDLSTDYAGIPLYGWLAAGALLFVLMSGKRR
jgi:hypothetical protein